MNCISVCEREKKKEKSNDFFPLDYFSPRTERGVNRWGERGGEKIRESEREIRTQQILCMFYTSI